MIVTKCDYCGGEAKKMLIIKNIDDDKQSDGLHICLECEQVFCDLIVTAVNLRLFDKYEVNRKAFFDKILEKKTKIKIVKSIEKIKNDITELEDFI